MPSIPSSLPPIQGIIRPEFASTTSTTGAASQDTFRALLEQSVRSVATREADAAHAVEQFLSGDQEDTHKTMLAVQRAGLAFEMFVQVRNKVVQAYQEVMRMPE